MFGEKIFRVTGRKDAFGEVESFICNACRFEQKDPSGWVIEGPRKIRRNSVISANHYESKVTPSVVEPIHGTMQPLEPDNHQH
jgi:NADH-quinone oxidoreductase subunit G